MADKKPEAAKQGKPQKKPADTPSGSADQAIEKKLEIKPSRSRRWPWLLLIIVLGLPALWFLMPTEIRQPYSERLQQWLDRKPPVAFDAPADVDAPPTTNIHQEETILEQIPAPLASAIPEAAPSSASSEEVEALMQSIDSLQTRLKQMQGKQTALSQAITSRQALDLRSRLRWIAESGNRLPQLQTYWQDISLLPILSETEHAQAIQMLHSTRQHLADVRIWQKMLTQLADSLPIPEAEQVNIAPDNKWLAWLAGQFRLSTSPSRETRRLLALRSHLLAVEQQLVREQWPQLSDWQHLLDQLRQQLGDDDELALPENFDAIQNDIQTMRQTAQSWLESLAGNMPEELN